MGKKIEQLEEEKMRLGLDVDIYKLEAEKLRKGKNKAEEDLDSLKMDYKKLRLSMRTTGLGKTLEQWRQKIKEEKNMADHQIRDRDYVMGEAVTQVREIADYLQTLAVQADVLSLKYESESSRGRDLAWLLREVKALGIRAKPYM
ncbi:hypothetical protein Gotur_028369 [Gossypium turneri]